MRVALTGHRPQRLGLPEDELDIKWAKIGHWIFNQILDVSDIYCGMANGSDILIGLNACVIKESYRSISEEFEKSRDLKLHCILPCTQPIRMSLSANSTVLPHWVPVFIK